MGFSCGSLVWVPDDKVGFLGCRVVAGFDEDGQGGTAKVLDEYELDQERAGEEIVVSANTLKDCLPMDEQSLRTLDNMVMLKQLNEGAILNNLKQKFLKDEIYTNVGTILVAINPFKLLPIYTPEILDQYKTLGGRSNRPHVFSIAGEAYKSLISKQQDQSCIISGESGAGKTETTKLFLQFLTEISSLKEEEEEEEPKGASGNQLGERSGLQEQILQANPLMEAFGNAKTVRNNNSSRFGKWIAISFDSKVGTMKGGKITSYLLEKSRLVQQSTGERNYHIFYQLCAGANANRSLGEKLELGEPNSYHYLNQSGKMTVDGMNDLRNWEKVQLAMDVMQFPKAEVDQCLEILAGILHLGNLDFEQLEDKGDGQAKICNLVTLDICARHLGLSTTILERVLTSKSVGVRSVILKPYTKREARHARDALAKAIYGQLFEWLINRINVSFSKGNDDSQENDLTIGVLDIFGFEIFQNNSFEQLCINYCNEKLQLHFNQHIFQQEQEEYQYEGIDVSNISFADNQPCVNLLEAKGSGIFALIDEEIAIPKGSDKGFLNKVLANMSRSNNVVRRSSAKDTKTTHSFIFCHYAGNVIYNVEGFLDKNKDILHDDLLDCVQASKKDLVNKLFKNYGMDTAAEVTHNKTRGSRSSSRAKRKTLGSKFKAQLDQLMNTLQETNPHFIRCIKPNAEKEGDLFTSSMVLSQLRCAGLLQVCKIRQIGYPVRIPFQDFVKRYSCIATLKNGTGVEELCNLLEKKQTLNPDQWKLGKTKVFLRNNQHGLLEMNRDVALGSVAAKVQSVARMALHARQFREYKEILKSLTQAQDMETMKQCLDQCNYLPGCGQHLDVVKTAKKKYERYVEEARVNQLLQDALGSLELVALNKALEAAGAIGLRNDIVEEAEKSVAKVEFANILRDEMQEAMSKKDCDKIETLLEKATTELGLSATKDDMIRQAKALCERLRGEAALREELEQALSSCKDPDQLGQILDEMAQWNLTTGPEVEKAQKVYRVLYSCKQAERSRDYLMLKDALNSKDLPKANRPDGVMDLLKQLEGEFKLSEAIKAENESGIEKGLQILGAGVPESMFKEAQLIVEKKNIVSKLESACKSSDIPALQELVTHAAKLGLSRQRLPILDQAHQLLQASGQDAKFFSALNSNDPKELEKLAEQAQSEGNSDLAIRAKDASEQMVRDNELRKQVKNLETAMEVSTCCQNSRSAVAQHLASVARQLETTVKDKKSEKFALEEAKSLAVENKLLGMAARIDRAIARWIQRQQLENQLREAMSTNDQSKMLFLMDEIEATFEDEGGDSHQSKVVENARSLLHRGEKVNQLHDELQSAMDEMDLDKLNDAVARLLEAGVTLSDELQTKVNKLNTKLKDQRLEYANLHAESTVLKSKLKRSQNLDSADLVPLRKALDECDTNQQDVEVRTATALLDRAEKQLIVQFELAAAMEADKRSSLKKAVQLAVENDLEGLETLSEARAALRMKDMKRRAAQRAAHEAGVPFEEDLEGEEEEEEKEQNVSQQAKSGGILNGKEKLTAAAIDGKRSNKNGDDDDDDGDDDDDDDDDEEEDEKDQLIAERRERARNSRFDFTRFHKLRSDDDFARGLFLLNKSRAKKDKCVYQTYAINKSIVMLGNDRELNKKAVRVHKSILGYCGEKSMAFPPTLARYILNVALENPELIDEVYIQLCKHLTMNPRAESVGRAWQLMCMAVGTFPPSDEFELHLLNFLLRNGDIPGLVGNYARYALRRLEGMIASGASGFVPSVEEIQAYSDRPPILVKISLVDSTVLTEELPITPDLNVGKVVELCAHFLGLTDPRGVETFGIFLNGQIPLRSDDFLGDEFVKAVREQVQVKFVFKRKIVLKMEGMDEASIDDPMYNRLVYLEAQSDFVAGKFQKDDLSSDDIIQLIAESLAVDFGGEDGLPDFEDCGLAGYVPPVPSCENLAQVAESVTALYEAKNLAEEEVEVLQISFVNKLKTLDHYGRVRFPSEDRGPIEVDSEGLHFQDVLVPFNRLFRWGGSAKSFTIVVCDPEQAHSGNDKREISFETTSGVYLGGCLLDHINCIMKNV